MPMTKTALEFHIAGARLALDLANVVEVLPCLALVKPPEMPPMLRGFANVEGRMVAMLKLDHLLKLQGVDKSAWNPEDDLGSMIVIARLQDTVIGWMVQGNVRMLNYDHSEMVRLPAQHVLNNCAEWVIARTPPEPSIVLLEMSKLLLEKERRVLLELQDRENERLREMESEAAG